MRGFLHLYFGDGKGKSTAAAGVVLRSVYRGKKIIYVPFLKDLNSSEYLYFKENTDVCVMDDFKMDSFFYNKSDKEKDCYKKIIAESIENIFNKVIKTKAELLVMDEALWLLKLGTIKDSVLIEYIDTVIDNCEVILTGGGNDIESEALLNKADYVTHFKCIKHPFEKGVTARIGIDK